MGKHSTDYSGCGIYALLDVMNSTIYIGHSNNIKQRFLYHKHRFKIKSNVNPMYSESIDNFVFLVLYKMSEEEHKKFGLIWEELFMVEAIESNLKLYNRSPRHPGNNIAVSLQYALHTHKCLDSAVQSTCGRRVNNIYRISEGARKYILAKAQ